MIGKAQNAVKCLSHSSQQNSEYLNRVNSIVGKIPFDVPTMQFRNQENQDKLAFLNSCDHSLTNASIDSPLFDCSPELYSDELSLSDSEEVRTPNTVNSDELTWGDSDNDQTNNIFKSMKNTTSNTYLFSIRGYYVIKQIGHGSFGKVYLAYDSQQNQLVALKLIAKNAEINNLIQNEVNIMKSLNHENICQLLDYFVTDSYHVLVLEYLNYGELFDLVADRQMELSQSDIKEIFRQCVDAVQAVHAAGIVHKDLKLENFLLHKQYGANSSSIQVKLVDFGFSSFIKESCSDQLTYCGSDEYMAPEIILRKPSIDPRLTDIWSLGVILYSLAVGYLPFMYTNLSTRTKMFHRIARGDVNFQEQSSPLNSDLKALILSILTTNPLKRLSIEQILEHRWLLAN